MSEVSRVSVGVEVTGLEKARGAFTSFEERAQKAASTAEAAMNRLEKAVTGANAAFERISTTSASSRPLAAFETMVASAAKSAQLLEQSLDRVTQAQSRLANQSSGLPPLRENFRGASAAADEVTQSIFRLIGAQAGVSKGARDSAKAFENAYAQQRRWGDALGQGFRFDEISRGAKDAASSFDVLFANQDKVSRGFRDIVNQRANVFDGVTRSARDAAAAFEELLENQQRVARQTQIGINNRMGIGQAPGRSASDAASSFAGLPDPDETRAKYNPLFEIGLRYREEVAAIRKANADGAIGFEEMNMAIERAGQVATMSQNAYINVSKTLEIAGGAAKLTTFQMTNLGYQVNDVATMFLMGASPFQIFASQAGQIVQALGDNPGGVAGSLRALRGYMASFATAIGPAGIGIAAVSAAAVGLAFVAKRDIEPIEDVIERQEAAVRRLSDAYELSANSADSYARRARGALTFESQEDYAKGLARLRGEAQTLGYNTFGLRDTQRRQTLDEFAPLREAWERFHQSAVAGMPDFIQLREELTAIAATSPDTTKWFGLAGGNSLGDAVREMLDATGESAELQQSLDDLFGVTDEGAIAARRMADAYKQGMEDIIRLAPDARTEMQRINDAFYTSMSNTDDPGERVAAILARTQAVRAMADRVNPMLEDARAERAAVGLSTEAAAVADAERRYQELSVEYEGNAEAMERLIELRDIWVDTARETAAHETRVKQQEEADRAAERAAEQLKSYNKGVQTRIENSQRTADALQLEIDSFGMSEGAVAALQFRFNALTEAKRAAAGVEGAVVSDDEVLAIEQAAERIGLLTDQLKAFEDAKRQQERLLEFDRDIAFRFEQTGRSEIEQRVADQLRGVGLVYGDAANATREAQLRHLETVEATKASLVDMGKVGADVFTEMAEAISSNENALDGFIGAIGRLNQEFVRVGIQRLAGGVFGTGPGGVNVGASFGASSGGISVQPPVVASVAPSATMPANDNVRLLNNNLRASSDSALAVAKQFDGLNEKANSKVLDSFMQASGTWNNLSAADTAWCAAFANAAIVKAGGQGTNSNRAASFLDWGMGTNNPQPGDIVVLKPQARGSSGHVTFFDGFDANGNVRGFGGNQSNMARTSTYNSNQVAAFRTAVRDGSIDASRAIASGAIPTPTARPLTMGAPAAGVGAGVGASQAGSGVLGGLRGFLQTPTGMAGMGAVSAFAGGMQSGSIGGGALNGGLAAFGMGLGPAGIALGAVGGLLGGIFGRSRRRREERRQRQEQERQQALQAQQQLEQQLPAILELQDTLLDRASGTLAKEQARISSQLKQYEQLAATAKNTTEQQRIASMQANLDDYMNRLYGELALAAESVIVTLSQGRGLDSEYAKATSGIRQMSLNIRNYLVDLQAATGGNADVIARATAAGQQQLLKQLSGADEVTDIYNRMDALTGTAAQLAVELQKLGMNADEATVAISEHLSRGIQKMRDDFVRSFADESAEGSGIGYAAQLRQLIERRNTSLADAQSLGSDPSLINNWFGIQARNILDQAGLVGDALEPLVKLFPELADVVGDSISKLDRSVTDAENDLRSAYSNLRNFADQLLSFRQDIRLDRNVSPLGPVQRLAEAQERFRVTAEKAALGDAVAQGELISVSRAYLDEAKSYYASSEAYFSIFREVEATLASTEARVLTELDLAKSQYAALLTLNESVLTIPAAIAALNVAMAARDLAQGQALEAYAKAMNPQAAVPSYTQPTVNVSAPAPAPAPAPPPVVAQPVNRTLWNGSSLSNYVGNYQEYNGRSIFVPSGWTPARAWGLHVQQQQRPVSFGGLVRNEKREGGRIGWGANGLGFRNGGTIGNGAWDRDSVVARHRDGGEVWLAGGEGVLNARAMQMPGVANFMEAANDGMMPAVQVPQMRVSTGEAAMADEISSLKAELRAVKAAILLTGGQTVEAINEGNDAANEQLVEMKLRRSGT